MRHAVDNRRRRQRRVRARVRGTADRPRLSVFRSHRHIAAQLIDDERGVTIAAVSDREFHAGPKKRRAAGRTSAPLTGAPGRMARAAWVGGEIAVRAKTNGTSAVRFDRGRYRYHGLIKALAEGARGGGLKF